jgi:hypothetical protein
LDKSAVLISNAARDQMAGGYLKCLRLTFVSLNFQDLQKFIENSLDLYRHELALILYPVFVHMYLELVYNGHEEAAKKFVLEYGAMQETFYQVIS